MMRRRARPRPGTRDGVAYLVAGYRSLFPEPDWAEPAHRSLQALRRAMITLAEIYQRERWAGEQEGRRLGEQEGHQALLELLSVRRMVRSRGIRNRNGARRRIVMRAARVLVP